MKCKRFYEEGPEEEGGAGYQIPFPSLILVHIPVPSLRLVRIPVTKSEIPYPLLLPMQVGLSLKVAAVESEVEDDEFSNTMLIVSFFEKTALAGLLV